MIGDRSDAPTGSSSLDPAQLRTTPNWAHTLLQPDVGCIRGARESGLQGVLGMMAMALCTHSANLGGELRAVAGSRSTGPRSKSRPNRQIRLFASFVLLDHAIAHLEPRAKCLSVRPNVLPISPNWSQRGCNIVLEIRPPSSGRHVDVCLLAGTMDC